MRATDAFAANLEGQSLAQDVLDATDRIYTAASVGSRTAVINEAGRLNQRAQAARTELRRLAGEMES